MPNFATSSAFVDTATKCLATASSDPRAFTHQSRAVCAFVIVSIVVNVFDEITNNVDAGSRPSVASKKSVASALATKRAAMSGVGEVGERFGGHAGPEVGAADADVDDGPDPLAGVAGPLAAPHPVGEPAHLVEDGVDRGNDVLAVDFDALVARRAERDVEDGAVFGDVDVLAGEHRIAELLDAGAASPSADEHAQRLGAHPLLRVVDVEVARGHGEVGAALRIGREQLAQMDVGHRGRMLGQRLPFRGVDDAGAHVPDATPPREF